MPCSIMGCSSRNFSTIALYLVSEFSGWPNRVLIRGFQIRLWKRLWWDLREDDVGLGAVDDVGLSVREDESSNVRPEL